MGQQLCSWVKDVGNMHFLMSLETKGAKDYFFVW
jgi:hypothetical protein